jgi:flavin-binding protein dodecin
MANSVYRVTEIVGTSPRSFEDAVKSAVQTAAKSLRDLRVAEVGALDVTVGDDGKVKFYRAKVKLSFKFELEQLHPADEAPAAPRPARPAAAEAAVPRTSSKKKVSAKKTSRKKGSKKRGRRG